MKIYVDGHSSGMGNGTRKHPFSTISEAAGAALAGDEVVVAPGIYRESVDPKNPGREDARIIYRSEILHGAVITGAEEVKNWTRLGGSLWTARVSNSIFGAYNPYTTRIGGDWYFGKAVRHTGAVYLNDRQLYEAETLEECRKGEVYAPSWEPEQSKWKWFAEQDSDTDETILYVNVQDTDPNRERVEINVRRRCFMPEKTGIDYITLSGFKICKAATTWAPPAAFQDGMVGPHWSKGWIIEDCVICDSKCCGISLGKYLDPENEQYFTNRRIKSPTQMEREAVCRGQYHGWLKEKVGGHVVRRCQIHHCEQAGIAGRMGCAFSVIEDNHIHHICNMQQLGGAETAGIKLHAAIDVTLRRNHIHHCIMGIWCDWQAQGTRITQNFLHHNYPPEGIEKAEAAMMSQDLFIEVSHGPTLIDNNVLLSKVSVRIAAQGVACVHNLMFGPLTSIGNGTDMSAGGVNQPRYTPYHIPHRTEVAGFMSILHGDDRFYNNIFIQQWPTENKVNKKARMDMGFAMTENETAGTSVFDGYETYGEWAAPFHEDPPRNMFELQEKHFAHLPVWSEGNVYLKGAKPWDKEQNCYCSESKRIFVDLSEEDGTYLLKTNLYQFSDGFRVPLIDSDVLGNAFEPDQRFENPDGTPIVFDRDFFGRARGENTIPGPFAEGFDEIEF